MSTASIAHGSLQKERDRTQWVPYYTLFVAMCGFAIALNAIVRFDANWNTLAVFAVATAVAQLTSVRLFQSSHSGISIVTVTTIGAIALLGPWGAALVGMAGGLMTVVTTSAWFTQVPKPKTRAKWWHRGVFNTSLRIISALCAGMVYQWAVGTVGTVATLLAIPALFVTVVVDEAVTTLLLMVVVHLQTGRRLVDIWRQDWEWTYPITLASGVIGGGGVAFAYETTGMVGLAIFMLPTLATGYAFHLYANRMRSYIDQLGDANTRLEEANLGLLQTLSAVIDAYDIYTLGHSAQVARYAEAIAKAMGLPVEEQTKIYQGGLIHDVGKIGVTDAIIGKKGRLTDEEYNALKLHTVIGAEIVSQMPQFQELVPLVRNHHERWDGRGYPDQLKGTENSLGARIMCLADSVEAMLSDRPYQATRSLASVVEEVIRCSGAQFDPQVVEAFLKVVQSRGETFFVNSASAVAHKLAESGALDTLDGRCYLKKSMIKSHLQAANTTSR